MVKALNGGLPARVHLSTLKGFIILRAFSALVGSVLSHNENPRGIGADAYFIIAIFAQFKSFFQGWVSEIKLQA